jgi:hypothetical protein
MFGVMIILSIPCLFVLLRLAVQSRGSEESPCNWNLKCQASCALDPLLLPNNILYYHYSMCQYPKTRVPLTAVRRHGARAAISSRAVNCARPHHVDGFGIATWPGKTDPHGKVSDPCIRVPNHRAGSRTSADTNRTTLSRVPGSWDKEYPGLDQGQVGSGADTCPNHTMYTSAPHSGGDRKGSARSSVRWR